MNPTILLLSNEPNAARSFTAALLGVTREGPTPQLLSESDGDRGLEIATTESVDLVIAELALPRPGLSGLAVLQQLSELRPKIKTILVSDHDFVADLVEGVVDRFLPRSTDSWGEGFIDELARHVVLLLGQARASGQPWTSTLLGGKYRLGDELGRGGMGTVFQAEDTFIHRKVAIKLLELPPSVSPEVLQRRMRREVMIAGRMIHPNLVTVYDAGFDDENLYLVMELVQGRTLAQYLTDHGGALPIQEAVRIADAILSALTYAHAMGVVHCDLKPENVLLALDRQVKVTDFGIARLFSRVATEDDETRDDSLAPMFNDPTLDGTVPGTVAYMAPEQLIGERVDHRADLYSVGVLLFEMLHGVKISTLGTPLKRATKKLPPLEGEPHLTEVLERAMALERGDRWSSAEEFAHALIESEEPSWWRRLLPWELTLKGSSR